jgi:hypothetical protein
MDQQVQYAKAPRGLSSAAIASCCLGIFAVSCMAGVAYYGLPPGASNGARWLMVVPIYLAALIGLSFSIVAIIGQRRHWYLAIPGLLISGFPLGIAALVAFSRYR